MKPRRIFLTLALLVLTLAAVLVQAQDPAPSSAATSSLADSPARSQDLAQFEATLRSFLARGVLPIIDVEHHWGGKKPVEELLAKMDKNGVALTWVGQNERVGSANALAMHAQYPGRLVPTIIHGDGPRWHGQDWTLIEELRRDALSGRYFAMGEFEARHYVSSTNNRDVHLPLDSPYFESVFALAQESGLPFLVHHEAEDALLPEMERMLAKYPGATVVWCHVGRNRKPGTWTTFPTPDGVRAFIARYPNLHFDLNQAKPGGTYEPTGQVDAVLYEKSGSVLGREDWTLSPAWKRLLEEHPDRFLIGTDVNTGRWDGYDRVVDTFRSLILSALSRPAAEKIAWKNAWRLMGGGEWWD